MEKATEQCIQQRQTVVMLVPEDMSVGWFSKALESVDEVRIITDGRINFIEPSTGLEKKGNSKGSMLLIWRPFIFGHTQAVKPLKFANQMYIDTGAVFCGNLTLIQVQGEGA